MFRWVLTRRSSTKLRSPELVSSPMPIAPPREYRWTVLVGTVALADEEPHPGDSLHEIAPTPLPPTRTQFSLRGGPVPSRGHHVGGPVVLAVRSFLPGRRGAPGRARHRGRPREHLPVGPAVRAGVRRGSSGLPAHRGGSLARR